MNTLDNYGYEVAIGDHRTVSKRGVEYSSVDELEDWTFGWRVRRTNIYGELFYKIGYNGSIGLFTKLVVV